MNVRNMLASCGLALATVLLSAADAPAGFNLIEDFDQLTLGEIGGQTAWHASSGVLVAADPVDAANQVLSVAEQSVVARTPTLIPAGAIRMLFLRFRFEKQLTASFGLSPYAAPSQFGDFAVELSLVNTSPNLRIANGDTAGVYDTIATLAPDIWYNAWVLVDHASNTSQVWLNDEPGVTALPADKLLSDALVDEFGFRASTASDLKNFYIKTGSGGSGEFGPLLIDDIYLENSPALNFSNPTAPLPGDFDRSGTVDAADLAVWQAAYGVNDEADANGDGVTDGADFAIWQTAAAAPAVSCSAIPEPGAIVLAAAALAFVAMQRKVRVRR